MYQFYLGAYDGNPANLNPLPPQESAKRYVELIGGADKAVAAAQTAFDKGDYRWAAELLNHAVFAEPDHKAAKELLARTYDQMGYMAEAATWRNSYLTAAAELRNGPPKKGIDRAGFVDMLLADAHRAVPRSDGSRPGRPGRRRQGPEGQPGAQRIPRSRSCCGSRTPCCHYKKSQPAADGQMRRSSSPKPIFVRMISASVPQAEPPPCSTTT